MNQKKQLDTNPTGVSVGQVVCCRYVGGDDTNWYFESENRELNWIDFVLPRLNANGDAVVLSLQVGDQVVARVGSLEMALHDGALGAFLTGAISLPRQRGEEHKHRVPGKSR